MVFSSSNPVLLNKGYFLSSWSGGGEVRKPPAVVHGDVYTHNWGDRGREPGQGPRAATSQAKAWGRGDSA